MRYMRWERYEMVYWNSYQLLLIPYIQTPAKELCRNFDERKTAGETRSFSPDHIRYLLNKCQSGVGRNETAQKRGAPSSLVKQKGGWKKVEEKVNKQWTKNNEKIQMKKMTSGCFVLLWWLQMIVPTGTVVSAVVITNVTNINETKQSHNKTIS